MKRNFNSLNPQAHFVKLDGTFNTRDLGGYFTSDGHQIKSGRLYRSDDLFALTPRDQNKLARLGINTIIDYRNTSERKKRPNRPLAGAKTYLLAPDDAVAAIASSDLKTDQAKIAHLIELDKKHQLAFKTDFLKKNMVNYVNQPYAQKIYAQMLQIIGQNDQIIALQHCRGGKDRTGYGAAITLIALGVPEKVVIADYLATAYFNQKRNAKRMAEYKAYTNNQHVLTYLAQAMATRASVITAVFAEMKRLSGTPINYLQEYLHLSDNFIQQLRQYYLI